MNTENRIIGLDIIRIIAMIIVTSIHFELHLDIARPYDTMPFYNRAFVSWLQSMFPLFVNLFVMLSGFLLCDKTFRIQRISKLWCMVYVSSTIVSLLTIAFIPSCVSPSTLLHGVFPILSNNYWYFYTYFLLLLFMPLLNAIARNAVWLKNVAIMGGVIIALTNINPFKDADGVLGDCSLMWFAYMYLVGAYVKNYDVHGKRKWWAVVLAISMILQFVFAYQQVKLPHNIILDARTALLPILSSVAMFLLLKDFKTAEKTSCRILKQMGEASVYVYIIQENAFLRSIFWEAIAANNCLQSPILIVRWLLAVVVLFIAAVILEKIVSYIYTKWLIKLDNRLASFLESCFQIK